MNAAIRLRLRYTMWEKGHFHIQDGLGFWIPWAVDSGLQVLDSSLCQWNWDSGFQSLVGFRIPKAVFRIPKPRIAHFFTLGDPNLGAKYSRNCLLSASYPDVSLLMKMCAQRKAGRKQRARRLAVGGRSCFQDGGKSNGGPICNF